MTAWRRSNLDLDAQHVDLTYFNYLEDDPVVIADAEQIKRVINNIVSNSIKYMDKSHKVINIRLRMSEILCRWRLRITERELRRRI